MSDILVIDNSKIFGEVVAKRIQAELGLTVHSVQSYADAKKIVNNEDVEIFMALVGLYLQDAHSGAVVDLMLAKRIPTIVFTGKFSDELRDEFLSKKVVDYVLKEDIHSLDYVVSLIRRIKRNKSIKILIVDDSYSVREHIGELLKVHQYIVFKAADGNEADEILVENPDIRLVITDYNMPDMDGFKLTKNIRQNFSKEEMAIIGLSGQGSNKLSARFIKNGANDFMTKPFLTEEFYCRITQNIEMLEYIEASKEASNKDYLTGLYNRRYLFEVGKKLHANSKRKHITLAVAMVDIDHFKNVNDTYGHDAGDLVIKKISAVLQERFREADLVARFGGEEFCILTTNMNQEYILCIFDDLREAIEKTPINIGYKTLRVNVSIGVCAKLMDTLEMMIKLADTMLYEAKEGGRNRVILIR
jgi:diguanylate cyclase (GGDEF)-like protein